MDAIHLRAGDVLYREGEESDAVYFIENGRLEVRRETDPAAPALAVLGKGEIIGEMGVVRATVRSASIVAVSDATLSRIDGPTFIKAFGGPDGLALKLLRMVCDRLSAVNENNAAAEAQPQASWRATAEARLLGATPEISKLLGNRGVRIKDLPFDVGMAPLGAGGLTDGRLGVTFHGVSEHLDKRHFRLELAGDGRMQLRDLGSRLGCVVNGRRIVHLGDGDAPATAPLHFGDNRIIAGGADSPVAFILRVRRKEA